MKNWQKIVQIHPPPFSITLSSFFCFFFFHAFFGSSYTFQGNFLLSQNRLESLQASLPPFPLPFLASGCNFLSRAALKKKENNNKRKKQKKISSKRRAANPTRQPSREICYRFDLDRLLLCPKINVRKKKVILQSCEICVKMFETCQACTDDTKGMSGRESEGRERKVDKEIFSPPMSTNRRNRSAR